MEDGTGGGREIKTSNVKLYSKLVPVYRFDIMSPTHHDSFTQWQCIFCRETYYRVSPVDVLTPLYLSVYCHTTLHRFGWSRWVSV